MIDEKELRLIRLNELSDIGANMPFYMKTEKGFERCCLYPEDLTDPSRVAMIRHDIQRFVQVGILYVNRNTGLRAINFKRLPK